MSEPIVILGAGLAGLSCAYHLRLPCVVYERDDAVGGTARTCRRGDFYFDCTGHWLHLRDADMQALVHTLLPDEILTLSRRAAVYSHGVRTAYPFQAHTYGLPTPVVAECLLGFFAAREKHAQGQHRAPHSFEDYIRQCLGDGIARHFMIPYNTKLWTVPPADMAHDWCGRFVPIPSPDEVVQGALSAAGAGHALGYNAHFLYPRHGGIGRLSEALHAAVRWPVHRNRAAQQIDPTAHQVTLADGAQVPYRTLVSTLPLPALIACMTDVPDAVRAAAGLLRATQVTYWDIGLARPNAPDDPHWIYFPDPAIPFYRVGSASAVLPGMAPPGHSSMYVEMAHPQGTACPASDADVLQALRRVGLLGPHEEPVLWCKNTLDHGYAIMDHRYGPARATVLAWLESQNIISTGRYGAWIYDSMEGALLQGREVARTIEAMT